VASEKEEVNRGRPFAWWEIGVGAIARNKGIEGRCFETGKGSALCCEAPPLKFG